MARRRPQREPAAESAAAPARRRSALLDTRIIHCGDCLDPISSEPRPSALYVAKRCQGSGSGLLPKLPDACVDRLRLWHRFPTRDSNSNRNYQVFWGGRSEPLAEASGPLPAFEDRHASTQAYIDYMQPRCVELTRVLRVRCRQK